MDRKHITATVGPLLELAKTHLSKLRPFDWAGDYLPRPQEPAAVVPFKRGPKGSLYVMAMDKPRPNARMLRRQRGLLAIENARREADGKPRLVRVGLVRAINRMTLAGRLAALA